MSENVARILFSAILAALKGERISTDHEPLMTEECLAKVLHIAKKHDVAHLAMLGLSHDSLNFKAHSLIQDGKQLLKLAIYRHEKLNYELKQICGALEKEKIPFMPLKGSVLREYYPAPWMRTCCDVDVLVHKADAVRAKTCLVDNLGYTVQGQFSHDISLFSQSNTHVELHFNLIEDNIVGAAAEILNNVWDYANPKAGYESFHEMSDEMFYFYHIAHMAKHFENGGCGIRPFIDLWILDHLPEFCPEKRDALLKQGGLLQFANAARRLSKVWLDGAEHDPITRQTEIFLLRGGIYGNSENRITLQQQKKGGAVRFALSRVFLPYDMLKFHYPILQKHRWLTPVMEVRRWGRLLFCGHARRVTRELRFSQSLSKDTADQALQLLQDLGLA